MYTKITIHKKLHTSSPSRSWDRFKIILVFYTSVEERLASRRHQFSLFLMFQGTNEILRMYIALTGMQYAGKKLSDFIR